MAPRLPRGRTNSRKSTRRKSRSVGKRERNNERQTESRHPSGDSSSKSKIFYSREFLGQSASGLWPGETRGSESLKSESRKAAKPLRDILENRKTRVLTLDLSKRRKKISPSSQGNGSRRGKDRDSPNRSDPRSVSEGSRRNTVDGKKPFQRFKPNATGEDKQTPRLTDPPVLRTYIAEKSGSEPMAPTSRDHRPTFMAPPSVICDLNSPDQGVVERRRLVFPTGSDNPEETHHRKFAKRGSGNGAITPRTRQMPHPGFNVPIDDSHFPTISSVVAAPWSGHSGESCGRNSGFPPLKHSEKTHKKLSTGEVRFISNLNAEQGTQTLNDAEALWQMMIAPVYGDPICLEEEFSELAGRYAKR